MGCAIYRHAHCTLCLRVSTSAKYVPTRGCHANGVIDQIIFCGTPRVSPRSSGVSGTTKEKRGFLCWTVGLVETHGATKSIVLSSLRPSNICSCLATLLVVLLPKGALFILEAMLSCPIVHLRKTCNPGCSPRPQTRTLFQSLLRVNNCIALGTTLDCSACYG